MWDGAPFWFLWRGGESRGSIARLWMVISQMGSSGRIECRFVADGGANGNKWVKRVPFSAGGMANGH
ncbi:hypothetical protein GCM10008967_14900 [Bacillus carboniphilus]|uniref:Uncharacterized protein n=1 Tax=Bacillus carboniphilus TaxID=86663 RepID=A0ABP3FUU0_9BACI